MEYFLLRYLTGFVFLCFMVCIGRSYSQITFLNDIARKRFFSVIYVCWQCFCTFFQGLPCHLYFDLEYNKKENPDKDGDEMVELLMSVVLEVLNDKYSIQGNPEWIVELDSSTEGMVSYQAGNVVYFLFFQLWNNFVRISLNIFCYWRLYGYFILVSRRDCLC